MFKKIVLLLACVIAIPLLGVLLILILGQSDLRTQQREYLAAGGILDLAQFKSPSIPDEVNAAKLYEPIFEFLDQLTKEERDLLGDEASVNDPALHALLLKCAETISAVRTVASLPLCNWDIQYELGYLGFTLPHLGKLRTTGRLLTSNIQTAAARAVEFGNNHDELIIQDIEAILHLARHCNEDDTLIGQFVTLSLLHLGMSLYEEVFNDHPAPPNDIADILAQIQQRITAKRMIQSETIVAQLDWRQVQDDTLFSDRSWFVETLFRDWERAFHLEWMRTALQNSERPFYETMLEPPDSPWYAEAADELISSYGRIRFYFARTQLKIEMLKTAEKLRAHKTKHGTYPTPGIIPMPIDPVTGKLIQYETINNGQGFKLTGLIGIPDQDEVYWVWEN